MYTLVVPYTPANRRTILAVLANFSGVEAQFVTHNCATMIQITTDSPATWAAVAAIFSEEDE